MKLMTYYYYFFQPESSAGPSHAFRCKVFKKPRPCHLCHQPILNQGSCCRGQFLFTVLKLFLFTRKNRLKCKTVSFVIIKTSQRHKFRSGFINQISNHNLIFKMHYQLFGLMKNNTHTDPWLIFLLIIQVFLLACFEMVVIIFLRVNGCMGKHFECTSLILTFQVDQVVNNEGLRQLQILTEIILSLSFFLVIVIWISLPGRLYVYTISILWCDTRNKQKQQQWAFLQKRVQQETC